MGYAESDLEAQAHIAAFRSADVAGSYKCHIEAASLADHEAGRIMANKLKNAVGVTVLIAICMAVGIGWAILQDPDPIESKDIYYWLGLLAFFGCIVLLMVACYFSGSGLRWLGSKIAAWAQASLPTPIFNACRWVVLAIAASWRLLIFLFVVASLGRALFG